MTLFRIYAMICYFMDKFLPTVTSLWQKGEEDQNVVLRLDTRLTKILQEVDLIEKEKTSHVTW